MKNVCNGLQVDGSRYTVHGTRLGAGLPIPNHQSPVTSHQSPIPNHQSPVTNPQSPITKAIMTLLLLFFLLPLTAQIELSKTVEKEFDLGKDGVMKVDHRYGLLKVIKSSDGKVHLSARFRIEGGDKDDIQKALDQFDIDINEFGNQVLIETDLHIKNWIGNNGRIRLTFDDRTKVKGLKKLKAEMLLSIPDLKSIALKNKYEDIIIDHDIKRDLEVVLYDGDLRAKDIDGNLDLNVKYGKAYLSNVQNADITLYDSKMELENAKEVKLSSKYSEYTIGDTENMTIKAYDDEIELGNVKGRLDIKDKYSKFKLGNFGEALLDIYDAKFTGKKGGKLTIDGSKYSKYRFVEIETLEIDRTYDDEFIIKNLKDLEVTESKYTKFELTNLSGRIDLLSSHDDKLTVLEIASSFKGLKLKGKYTKVNLDIPNAVKYELDAEMTHGSIDYPEDAFDNNYYKEKGSILEVRGKMKGAGADAPKVVVDGYDCKVVLE